MSTLSQRFITIILALIPTVGFGQFVDDFSDGDFTTNPAWSGDAANFEVDGSQRLWLNAPSESDTSYLSVSSEAIDDATWEFLVELDFNPSSSNLARVYLVSNNPNLKASLNGYYVRLGGETEDRISLYRQDGTSSEQLITSVDNLLDTDPAIARIRVTRTGNSDWELLADTTGGTTFASYGTANDTTYEQSLYSGVWCKYTSTRSDKFYFDDFNVTGNPFVDSEAPTVSAVNVISDTELDVRFSEIVDQTTAETLSNYSADGGLGNPSSVVREPSDQSLVRLTFATQFTNGTPYNLTISSVQDLSGNAVVTVTQPFIYVIPSPASFRDVVINEFMADETPTQGTPETEYVEVFNATQDKFIEMTGWKLCDNSSCGTIQELTLGPGDFALLVPTSGTELFPFTPNVTRVTSWAALNNSGDDISLLDTAENLIDFLSYTDDWYQDDTKDDGGWSLEQVDPNRNCSAVNNWRVSENPNGGTPGFPNSVLDLTPDTIGPELTDIEVLQPDQIRLLFNEPLEETTITQNTVTVNPPHPILVVAVTQPDLIGIDVLFTEPIDTGVTYTFIVNQIADCEGNLQEEEQVRSVLLPFNPDSGELVINEVLFNPYTGGRDYVELFNRSNRSVNLKNCLLANFEDDTVSNLRPMIDGNLAVPPGGYVCLTQDTMDVIGKYVTHGIGNFVQMASLPSYNNDEGNVLLLGPDSSLFERFNYNEDMHFSLLDDVNGVSLERLDVNRPVNDMGNWHSAAETVGFGTPGLENSQYYPTSGADGEVSMDPEIFSPDNDGYNDVLNINYRFTAPGYVGTIRIYDSNGRPVRELATNELLSNEGTFTWDGTTDKGEKARIGMYVILFEAYSTSGHSQKYKMSTVLGGRI